MESFLVFFNYFFFSAYVPVVCVGSEEAVRFGTRIYLDLKFVQQRFQHAREHGESILKGSIGGIGVGCGYEDNKKKKK